GIGERNGITPLGGLIARLSTLERRYVERYNLQLLSQLDQLIADTFPLDTPVNHYITGPRASIHTAGIHPSAVLAEPTTYQILRREEFGVSREVAIGHRLTGWNAIRERAISLGLQLEAVTLQAITQNIKRLADTQPLSLHEVDQLIREAAQA